jgi:hypothetical protein
VIKHIWRASCKHLKRFFHSASKIWREYFNFYLWRGLSNLINTLVEEYITPEQFEKYRVIATQMGFSQVASGPMVRSSYHADLQASGELIT